MAGGIGRYLGVDPVVVRVVLVLAVLASGIGLLVYGVAWLVMPEDDGSEAAIDARLGEVGPGTLRAAGTALLVLAAFVVIDGATDGDWLLPLLLLGVGGWLLLRPDRDGGAAGDPLDAGDRLVDGTPSTAGASPATAPAAPTAPVPPPPAHRRPSGPPTGRYATAVVAIVLGAAGLAWAAGASLSPVPVLVACLAVVSAGLLVGAVTGRARGLVLLAIPLLVVLGLVRAVDVPLGGGVGERRYAPTDLAGLRDEYRLLAGDLEVDLRGIDAEALDGQRRTVEVGVALGEVLVRLPDGVAVTVDAEVDLGELDVRGVRDDGVDVRRTLVLDGPEGAGALTVVVDAGAAEVTIR